MLSSDDYYDFQDAVEEILDKCFIGVDPETITKDVYFVVKGYTNLTRDKKYCFTQDAENVKEDVIRVCEALPRYPAIHPDSCSTIVYADLLPDDMSTKRELLKACELADEFFALLEANEMGVVTDIFKSKYGFQMVMLLKGLQDKLGPNRSAYVEE